MPVALSGVILGAVTVNGGSSQDRPPENALSMMSPVGPFGVWQLPQVITVLTRYLPRSAGVSARAMPAAIASTDSATSPVRIMIRPLFVCPPAKHIVTCEPLSFNPNAGRREIHRGLNDQAGPRPDSSGGPQSGINRHGDNA